jgi:hypothetical protein
MDDVQKHSICTNVPSSQNFRSYLQGRTAATVGIFCVHYWICLQKKMCDKTKCVSAQDSSLNFVQILIRQSSDSYILHTSLRTILHAVLPIQNNYHVIVGQAVA